MEMTGQVSIGKEYWSVIGPKFASIGEIGLPMEHPCNCL